MLFETNLGLERSATALSIADKLCSFGMRFHVNSQFIVCSEEFVADGANLRRFCAFVLNEFFDFLVDCIFDIDPIARHRLTLLVVVAVGKAFIVILWKWLGVCFSL